MRPYLFLKREKDEHGKKKKKQYSAARRAMVKGFILLKLEPKQPETQAAEHSTDGVPMQPEVLPLTSNLSGWHQLAIDLAPPPLEIQPDKRNSAELPDTLWYHIGYVNYKTMHFSGLPLTCIKVMNHGRGPPHNIEAHLEAKDPVVFFRSFEFLKERVSFSHAYVASFWLLDSSNVLLPQSKMMPKHVVAFPYSKMEPFNVWKGTVQEAKDRKDLEEKKKTKLEGGGENTNLAKVKASLVTLELPREEKDSRVMLWQWQAKRKVSRSLILMMSQWMMQKNKMMNFPLLIPTMRS